MAYFISLVSIFSSKYCPFLDFLIGNSNDTVYVDIPDEEYDEQIEEQSMVDVEVDKDFEPQEVDDDVEEPIQQQPAKKDVVVVNLGLILLLDRRLIL